jgi:hypothetical protein
MEGLLGQPMTIQPPFIVSGHQRAGTIIHRWLFFFFLMMIGLIVFAALTAEALSGV